MTSHVARLYGLVGGVLVFFVAWAAVVAHPWAAASTSTAKVDPRVAQLTARQHALQAESVRVRRIVNARWAAYRHALAQRNAQNAAAAAAAAAAPPPAAVRVVNLPPLVVTRTS